MTPSIPRRLAVARAGRIASACLSIFDGVDIGMLLSNWGPCS